MPEASVVFSMISSILVAAAMQSSTIAALDNTAILTNVHNQHLYPTFKFDFKLNLKIQSVQCMTDIYSSFICLRACF